MLQSVQDEQSTNLDVFCTQRGIKRQDDAQLPQNMRDICERQSGNLLNVHGMIHRLIKDSVKCL